MTTPDSPTRPLSQLWLVVPPMLPLVCALAFAAAMPGLADPPGDFSASLLPEAERRLVHLGNLLTYGAVGLLHVALCLTAVVVFMIRILRLPAAQRDPALATLALGVVILVAFVLYSYAEADRLSLIRLSFKSICELMLQADLGTALVERCYGADNESALSAMSWIPTFLGMAAVATAVGLAAGLAAPIDGEDEASWRRAFEQRSKQLQTLLYALSAVLVTSTLAIVLFASLPVGLLAEGGGRNAVASFAHGLGAFWGVVFTLTLIGAVLPAAVQLYVTVRRHQSSEVASDEFQAWLREHVYVSTRKQLGNAALLLAPLIAGPAGGLLEKAFG